jgi:hypothetical protein
LRRHWPQSIFTKRCRGNICQFFPWHFHFRPFNRKQAENEDIWPLLAATSRQGGISLRGRMPLKTCVCLARKRFMAKGVLQKMWQFFLKSRRHQWVKTMGNGGAGGRKGNVAPIYTSGKQDPSFCVRTDLHLDV